MDLDKIMDDHGFSVSSSCSGFEWYKKTIQYQGKEAFITITDPSATGLPKSLDEPVVVEMYDMESGKELGKSQNFGSLRSYLETLDQSITAPR